MSRGRLLMFRILTAVYVCTVALLSILPRPPGEFLPSSDKTKHFIAYGLMAVFVMLSLSNDRSLGRRAVIAVVAANALGIVIELLQPFTGRSRDAMDVVANFVGSVLGTIVVSTAILLLRRKPAAS